jgi:hypothetical protein
MYSRPQSVRKNFRDPAKPFSIVMRKKHVKGLFNRRILDIYDAVTGVFVGWGASVKRTRHKWFAIERGHRVGWRVLFFISYSHIPFRYLFLHG